ncbi:MAG: hypothetical protein RBS88_09270 [Spongiibacteraceae bacterium]|jgi:hypothetical protein|nr:hypothetical protein [Spongiibacteraceae bacterium]
MSYKLKEAILAGLIGGGAAAVLAFLMNHYVVPFPATAFDNSLGHGISGLFSGLLSGFIGVYLALGKAIRDKV